MNTFKLTVVTPSGELFSTDEAKKAAVRTRSGQITILAKHTPLVSVLSIGQLVVTTKEKHRLAVFGGFIEVRENGDVIILADEGERPAEIDVEQAKAAKEETQKILSSSTTEDRKSDELAVQLQREITRIKVADSLS